VGGSGNDILVAGLGRQAISGGAGRDAFVLSQGGIQARISDFTPGQDQLVFEQAATADQLNRGLTVTRQGNDSLLRFQGSEALLVGLTPNQLRHGDLAFQL
jgi:Ca2+-binding RTX toxin-like protein